MKPKINIYTKALEKEIEDAKITLEQYEWPDELQTREMTEEEKQIYDLAFHAGREDGLRRAKKVIEVVLAEFIENLKKIVLQKNKWREKERGMTWEIKQYN